MKLIDKDALVAEVERLKECNRKICAGDFNFLKESYPEHYYSAEAYNDILSFLDTLEVKEVDLEKEVESLIKSSVWRFANKEDFLRVAKHFYELGLQARIDKELVEEVYAHIDGIKNTADRMTSGNFMHNRAAIKFSANTIAKVLELIGLKREEV